jgi:hypothetical protein
MTNPRILWHASRADIDRPTIAGRTEGDNHANSGLGIYCAMAPYDYINGFGAHIHALTLKEDVRVLSMKLDDLRRMGERAQDDPDRKWYEAQGRRLARDYDIIEIVEINGAAEQAIILSDEAVVSSQRMTSEEFARIATDRVAAKKPKL